MPEPKDFMWLIPCLPLLASALIAFLGPRFLKQQSHWVCIAGAIGAFLVSVCAALSVANGYEGGYPYFTWFSAGRLDVSMSLRLDGLTAVMLLTVTFIGSLIAIYAAGYMHGDPGYPRFFALVSLFLFSMTLLVMADNFLVLYAGWELVGVCSYLLVGFWFIRPAAAAAARKAFLVTRLGDIGLLLGILMLWARYHSVEYDEVFHLAQTAGGSVFLTVACILLFTGAVGKSAQFPLYVWLPDAMQGPSPVSALIHAATMVTAGVYLVARCMPLFGISPEAQLVVAWIGGFTALFAALMALTRWDLKQVLAYSTISQLGYMFLALGSGIDSGKLAGLAVTAAIFHLVTHAFFKGLLFLSAGSVMHAMGDVIDMRQFSGLRKVLPTTHWVFLCGAAALAGFPIIFSGFWSKDEILHVTWLAGHETTHAAMYQLLFYSALLTAGLTAFYTARAYFLTFWGEVKLPPQAGHHGSDDHSASPHGHSSTDHSPATTEHTPVAHASTSTGGHTLESPPIMLWPMMVLAAGSVLAGLLLGPTGLMEHFLEKYWMHQAFHELLPAEEHGMNLVLMFVSSVVALGGIAIAWFMYVKRPGLASQISRRFAIGYELSLNRFYVDELYEAFIVKPMAFLAHVLRVIDQYFVDGVVDLIGQIPSLVGAVLRPVQNGLVQFYALLMILGVGGFLLSILLR